LIYEPAGFSFDMASENFRMRRTSSSMSCVSHVSKMRRPILSRAASTKAVIALPFGVYDRFAHPTVHGAPLAAHQIEAFDGLLQATVPDGFEIAAKTVPLSEVEQAWPNGGFRCHSTKAAAASYGSGRRHSVL
jgi:hypothetical protein